MSLYKLAPLTQQKLKTILTGHKTTDDNLYDYLEKHPEMFDKIDEETLAKKIDEIYKIYNENPDPNAMKTQIEEFLKQLKILNDSIIFC